MITSCLGFLSVIPAMYLIDNIGYVWPSSCPCHSLACMLTRSLFSRRYSLMLSFFLQGLWMYLLAGLGEQAHKTSTDRNAIVAAFMLYAIFYNVGSGPCASSRLVR